jgi:CubicO group peptidase (beta-lactamase class C family)
MTPTAADLALMQGAPPPSERQVTLANWQEGPFNRWAFQHVSEVVPCAMLPRGDGPVLELPSAPEDLDAVLGDFLERTYTDGFLVLRDGRIIYERYLNGMAPHTPHLLQSVSKSFCSALTGTLAERGVVQLDAPVRDYVPELWASAFGDATLGHLLDMTASVVFSEEYADPGSEVQAQDRAAGWRPRRPEDPESSYAFLAGLRKAGEHGRAFQYCSASTDALAWVLERATGRRYCELLAAELWAHLGAEHDAAITVDSAGFGFANGGMSVTLRDLARFGWLMLNGGGLDEHRVAPERWAVRHLEPGNPLPMSDGDFKTAYPNGSYSSKWWCTGDARQTFYGVGIYGQYVWIVPAARIVLAKLSSVPRALDPEVTRDHHVTFRGLVEHLEKAPTPT